MSGVDFREITCQRVFKIPRNKLDLFLVKINMSDSNLSRYVAEYVFQNGKDYDVVVNEYGHHYPYQFNDLEKFVKQLRGKNK